MGLVLTTVFGFVVWIVLWAINVKAFDAFMITIVIIVRGRHHAHPRARTCRATGTDNDGLMVRALHHVGSWV